jgi:hypothetical protein
MVLGCRLSRGQLTRDDVCFGDADKGLGTRTRRRWSSIRARSTMRSCSKPLRLRQSWRGRRSSLLGVIPRVSHTREVGGMGLAIERYIEGSVRPRWLPVHLCRHCWVMACPCSPSNISDLGYRKVKPFQVKPKAALSLHVLHVFRISCAKHSVGITGSCSRSCHSSCTSTCQRNTTSLAL